MDIIQYPSNQQMYNMIIELNSKYEKLQNDFINIKKSIKNNQKSLIYNQTEQDIIQLLNFKYNNIIDFQIFLTNIQIDISNIEYVFKHDYILGLSHIFQSYISSFEYSSLPFRAFNNYKNIIFIYTSYQSDTNNSRWIVFDNVFNDYFFGIINTKLLNALKQWYTINQSKINDEIFTKIYFTNLKKILGTNFKNDVKIAFKNKLYSLYKNHLNTHDFL